MVDIRVTLTTGSEHIVQKEQLQDFKEMVKFGDPNETIMDIDGNHILIRHLLLFKQIKETNTNG